MIFVIVLSLLGICSASNDNINHKRHLVYPCRNGGTVVSSGYGHICICTNGWTGRSCENPLPSPTSASSIDMRPTSTVTPTCHCRNGGTCLPNGECYCPIGMGGPTCDYYNDFCLGNPCQNGGTCREERHGYRCECVSGTSGRNCEIAPTPPQACHCKNGGTCYHDGYCSCPYPYTGDKCETHICDFNPCKQGGGCVREPHGYRCRCPPGTSGKNCENTENIPHIDHICEMMRPCRNGGTCVRKPIGFGYTCICVQGFTSKNCDSSYLPSPTSASKVQATSSTVRLGGMHKREPAKSRNKRELETFDKEDADTSKRICQQNELKAKTLFSDESTTKSNWETLHPAIKAVLMDLVANDDHKRLSRTHAQIEEAVAENDLMKMSKIMADRNQWKRVPISRYWKRKQMMKKAVKNPWKSMFENDEVC